VAGALRRRVVVASRVRPAGSHATASTTRRRAWSPRG
jgi:hypothetical protein